MIGVADLHGLDLFQGLTDAQLADLVAAGEERHFGPGDVLFQAGEHADAWWVLVEGAVDLMRHIGREDVVVRTMDVPGLWAGGFGAWDAHGVYLATGRGATDGRMLRVPAPALRDLTNAWFPLATHLLEGLHSTARSIESTARHRESLVTLGTLAAGLAHEINNPAAAATRAVDSMSEVAARLLADLGELARHDITAKQFSAVDALRLELADRTVSQDALALADAEETVERWLDRHGVEDGWQLAPLLVAGGADTDWCDEVAGSLEGPALAAGLRWVASSLSLGTLLHEVREATRRVSDLVAAVQSYSQVDRGSRQRTDVTEGIESSLMILGHKLRTGITVVREYTDDVPQIDAYPGELNQVWANVIDNAVDAMEGSGTLRIATGVDGESVVVEITDTGPGMPPEVAERVFEAFYTTKDVGKGTGLGLDIARRIVEERHGGTITVGSRPDGTTMRVCLPVQAD
ncbi:MAG: sensor histidine kinase [Nocardioidaceae bacterium]